ncbi:hypothetical protein EJ03DRAFT_280396 [Teratosphaeria nubilosa]|uniref:Uncharacterized protein n=1 Tax=Teratosphaeria nubilosa TaxID=161662 RepID=A0A6G1KYZ8_9PEZI|nr:hypothetical protein EJ03DRAFT_280396 [Teratosphaeria nubilosa]
MPSGKNRLYVALYARGGKPKMPTLEDTYHWALITGPKHEDNREGWRFHAISTIKSDSTQGWQFEEMKTRLIATRMLLVRVCIGKIEKDDRVRSILRSVPIRDDTENWNCVYWVKEALQLLKADGRAIGTGELDWVLVRDTAMAYVKQKRDEHRFDGQVSMYGDRPPTYDLLEGREKIP